MWWTFTQDLTQKDTSSSVLQPFEFAILELQSNDRSQSLLLYFTGKCGYEAEHFQSKHRLLAL